MSTSSSSSSPPPQPQPAATSTSSSNPPISSSSFASSPSSLSPSLSPTSTSTSTSFSSSSSSSPHLSSSPPSSSLAPQYPSSTIATTPTATTSTSTSTTIHDASSSLPPPPPPLVLPPNQSPVTIFSAPPRPHRPDHLATIDLIIIVIYLCLLISTSISTMIRTRKSNRRKAALAAAGNKYAAANLQNNFMAGRKMSWFTVGASIFASNLGSEHFIGLSGSAAANGISVAAFEMNALIILQLATWVFLPVLVVSKISTLPEYMSKRFGGKRIRTYLAILSILLYIFTKISVNLYSGGIFLQQAIGWNLYSSAMFILALTSVMTLTGGLKGAMVIDNLQAIVMTIGASIVSTRALVAIGGWDGLRQRYTTAVPSKVPANLTHCAQPNPRAFQMLRPLDDRDMPWLGFLIGQTPASIWYWAADQMMVQRFLSARSLAHVQGSAVFAGYLKILPLVFMVIPGMISRCLFTDEVACIDPVECQRYCQSTVSCSNTAYPRLVLELMPMGARGMMVAAMVAALMGDLCNVFNSASALFSCDIWPLFRKHATPKEKETVGRVFVICLVLASIMWIPVIQEMQGGQLFIYIQAVAAMFAPPICAVYICAVLWKRTNETGAFWSMMLGFMLGLLRMCMSFIYKEPSCGQHLDERPWMLKHVHYMYYAAFLFLTTIASTMLISYCTKPPASFRLIRTTFWTRFDTNIRKDDKNVFEMKYSGAVTSTTGSGSDQEAKRKLKQLHQLDTFGSRSPVSDNENAGGPADAGLYPMSGRSSQQKLFTIDEQQDEQQPKPEPSGGADLSSIVVDINSAAAAAARSPSSNGQQVSSTSKPTAGPELSLTDVATPPNRSLRSAAGLPHQSSLTASATAAVGEAGKYLANKLASSGAKGMVLAAASHLTGAADSAKRKPDSKIKFKNLHDDDDEDEDDDDVDDDEREDDEDATTNPAESTMDDEDEDSGEYSFRRRHQKARNKRSQSVLTAALSSYKQKQRGGYQKAGLTEEDFEDEDEDEDEDDDDEKVNLNRSISFKNKFSKAARNRAANLINEVTSTTGANDAKRTDTSANIKGLKSNGARQPNGPEMINGRRPSSKRPSKRSKGSAGSKKKLFKYEEDVDDEDTESGRTYRCLDNSVALLIKTPLEDTILRIAVGAILLVAVGIFIIFSLPPTSPPKDVVDILIKN